MIVNVALKPLKHMVLVTAIYLVLKDSAAKSLTILGAYLV